MKFQLLLSILDLVQTKFTHKKPLVQRLEEFPLAGSPNTLKYALKGIQLQLPLLEDLPKEFSTVQTSGLWFVLP